jgi:hypothetical protein
MVVSFKRKSVAFSEDVTEVLMLCYIDLLPVSYISMYFLAEMW